MVDAAYGNEVQRITKMAGWGCVTKDGQLGRRRNADEEDLQRVTNMVRWYGMVDNMSMPPTPMKKTCNASPRMAS